MKLSFSVQVRNLGIVVAILAEAVDIAVLQFLMAGKNLFTGDRMLKFNSIYF